MDFFGDFCLSCDRQTNGSAFCSQACRLAELDHYTTTSSLSSSLSPPSPILDGALPVAPRTSRTASSAFYLPPAFDFSIYRVPSSNSLSSSLSSRPYSPKLSEQARNDLKDYVGAFDQTRTLRRRVSMQGNEDLKTLVKG